MDVNILRASVTLVSFAAFIGIVWFACAAKNRPGFADAAQLPFRDSAGPEGHGPAGQQP